MNLLLGKELLVEVGLLQLLSLGGELLCKGLCWHQGLRGHDWVLRSQVERNGLGLELRWVGIGCLLLPLLVFDLSEELGYLLALLVALDWLLNRHCHRFHVEVLAVCLITVLNLLIVEHFGVFSFLS